MILKPVLQYRIYKKALEEAAKEIAKGDTEKEKELLEKWTRAAKKIVLQ